MKTIKKTIYLLSVVIFSFGCNSDVSVDVTFDNISKIFNKNCETVLAYEQAFCQENIDYDLDTDFQITPKYLEDGVSINPKWSEERIKDQESFTLF